MTNKRVVAIVQARMGSTRLPGKVLLKIAQQSMLAHVVERVQAVAGVHEVVVATTTNEEDDAVVAECTRLGVQVFRGSDLDVLDRYHSAAVQYQADAVFRVCSDCPLLDPQVSSQVVEKFLATGCDLAANDLEPAFPVGLGTEVIDAAALARAWGDARLPYERTHVTPYIYRHPELFRIASITADEDASDLRWTVDSERDLALVRAIHALEPNPAHSGWKAIVSVLRSRPDLIALNRDERQKRIEEN